MGNEFAHTHDDPHCPLCNYNWPTTAILREEISSNLEVLAPALQAASNALTLARQNEQDAIKALALATSQKSAYDTYLARSNSVNQELQSFAIRSTYFETMNVQDFSGMNMDGLANMNRRVTSAIQIIGVLATLAEVEKFFGITPVNGATTRVATAVDRLGSYKKHFQDQFDQYEPARARLVLAVQGLLQVVQSKAGEIAGLNANIAAAVEITSSFDSHWRELFGDQTVSVESYDILRQRLGQRGIDVTTYTSMLDQCKAVVSVDTDSAKLKSLSRNCLS